MKRVDVNLLQAITRKAGDVDFECFIQWIRESRDEQRESNELQTETNPLLKGTGIACGLSEIVNLVESAPRDLKAIRAAQTSR